MITSLQRLVKYYDFFAFALKFSPCRYSDILHPCAGGIIKPFRMEVKRLESSGDVIYIDVLIAINLAVNYFLLLAAMKLCGRRPKRLRILSGAALGAVYSLVILLPDIPWLLQTLLRAGVSLLMVLACEGRARLSAICKDALVFFTVSFIFAGFMLALRMFAAPSAMIYSNGIVYLRVNALTLIIASISAYLLTELFFRIFRRKTADVSVIKNASVLVFYRDRTAETTGFIDTGNSLCDPLSGSPVAIAGDAVAKKLFTDEVCAALTSPVRNAGTLGAGTVSGFRLIPYSTVSGGGLIPVFRPDRLTVSADGCEYEIDDALLGFPASGGALLREDGVILNPELLTRKNMKGQKSHA